jgi:uncharacterized protein
MADSISLSSEEKQQLLNVAARSIDEGLITGAPFQPDLSQYSDTLTATLSAFVTLTLSKQLRGCIGSLKATQPLIQDVATHAFAAAFQDPRFPALQQEERQDLEIDISILYPAIRMSFRDENDLLAQLQPGVDGLILSEHGLSATFLPSVWESLTEPRAFLNALKQKAGLPSDYWSESLRVERYRTELVD